MEEEKNRQEAELKRMKEEAELKEKEEKKKQLEEFYNENMKLEEEKKRC